MNIFFPLLLAVMPTSISVVAFLLIVVAMGAIAMASLAADRHAALYAAAPTAGARHGAANDAAVHRGRVEAVAALYAAAYASSSQGNKFGSPARCHSPLVPAPAGTQPGFPLARE